MFERLLSKMRSAVINWAFGLLLVAVSSDLICSGFSVFPSAPRNRNDASSSSSLTRTGFKSQSDINEDPTSLRIESDAMVDANSDIAKGSAWWERIPKEDWHQVPENYNWDQRQTGIVDDWTAGLAIWKHYNESSLNLATSSTRNKPAAPIPWTSGLMCKFLRQTNNGNSFQLHSVYEPNATGFFGGNKLKSRENDNYLDLTFPFVKTPYRIAPLPFNNLPDPLLQAGAATSRTTIVQPARATFAGPRYLPTTAIQKYLLLNEAQRILYANNCTVAAESKPYKEWKFCELWVAEPVAGTKEGRKRGMFCQYNGISGELVQVFTIQEYALPKDMLPGSPSDEMDLRAMEHELLEQRKLRPWVSAVPSRLENDDASTDDMSTSIASYENIEEILRDGSWNCTEARAVRITQMLGSELELTLDDVSSNQEEGNGDAIMYQNPAFESNPDAFWDIRFGDGSFARIPRSLHPSQWDDDDELPIGMEFGCTTEEGEFHRLLATGSRHKGGLHTTVYERYSKIR